jgi:AcrR family transcriptional regulator
MKAGIFLHASGYLQNHEGVSRDGIKKEGGMRRRLMDAAREEFSQKGIEAATTRGIAERAGCNEVTLFRHFETKQKLLSEVVQETTEEFVNLCACGGDWSGDALVDLYRFARVYTEALEQCEGMARALIGNGNKQPEMTKDLVGGILVPFHERLGAYIENGKSEGRVREGLNGQALAEMFTATLMGGVLRRSSGLSELAREAWLRQTVELFWLGMSVKEGR